LAVWALALSACPGPAAGAPTGETREIPPFDAARAWKDVEAQVALGPRVSGSEAAEKTRAYFEAQLTAAGLRPVREAFTEETPAGEIAFCNVYADLAATTAAPETAPIVILLSHYDTKRFSFTFVGANDAASSSGALLELARALSTAKTRLVTYRFLFVDGEEAVRAVWEDPDNRYGSRHHVAQLVKTGLRPRVKAAVLLDMIGDKDLRIARDEYSTPWLYEAFAAAARSQGLGAKVDGRRERIADDHVSFLEVGIQAVDLIDFDYGPNNSYWHTQADTLDKCSSDSLAAAGKIVLAGLPAVEARLTR
jgi:hypothetical protein